MAQEMWSIDQCMHYAVTHNRTVKQRQLEADNDKMEQIKAIGNFLPGISGNISAQYNFGRSVDPETNTYNNISTFNNGYGLEASLSLFKGGSLINQVRRAKASRLLGKAELEEARDNTALETFQAYIDALYYYGTAHLAQKKFEESDSLLYKTRRQEELGLKGRADVAQMEAQQATDAYNLTRQRNLFQTAMLTLKQKMNYPSSDTLVLDTTLVYTQSSSFIQLDHEPAEERNLFQTAMLTLKQKMNYPSSDTLVLDTTLVYTQSSSFIQLDHEPAEEVYRIAIQVNPTLKQSALNKEVARMNRKISWGNLVPSITLFGGISSSYYKELHAPNYPYSGLYSVKQLYPA